MYVPDTFTAVEADFVYLGQSTDPFDGASIGISANDSVELFIDSANLALTSPAHGITRNRWTCIQAHIVVSHSGSAELFVDGTSVAANSLIDTLPTGGYSRLESGVTWTDDTQTNAEVYVDEIAVGTSPLPCDP